MARIPDHEIERLKKEISVARLAEARGIQLTRHGADLVQALKGQTGALKGQPSPFLRYKEPWFLGSNLPGVECHSQPHA